VQRVIAHEAVYEELREKLVTAARSLKTGDPREGDTFVGPMISEQEAARLQGWVDEAVQAGATVLCGGTREGLLMQPTLLENVDPSLSISCREAFGPVAVLSRFRSFDEALQRVNDSVFGLQTGVFTRDLYRAQRAWDELDVGGVVVGDVPSWRVDHMPYGGVKDSGLGREGVRWAMEDMCEVRLLAVRTPTVNPPRANP
jgi:acyl-CoA reductase-like NAD-dependent aldehyde dehydrogenase